MDFEFNQSSTASANGVTKVRTAGDMLITFDFGGSGAPVLSLGKWVTSGAASQCEASNTVPCWGKLVNLSSSGVADGSVNNKDVTDYNNPNAPRTLAGNVDSRVRPIPRSVRPASTSPTPTCSRRTCERTSERRA